jgi:hypothetical protein
VAFGEKSSAFWFHGRIHPAPRVPAFYAEEIQVEEDVTLEIICEGISVWAKPGTKRYKQPGEATDLFRLVFSAYALLGRDAFDPELEGWIEATKAQLEGSMVGFIIPRSIGPEEKESAETKRVQAAADLAIAVREFPSLRLAIRDIYAAVRDRDASDDAFFFAYRAVEDCARALSGADTDIGGKEWAALHERLGLDPDEGKERLEPLTRARRAAAHGNESAEQLQDARLKKAQLIDLARETVIRVLENTPDLEIESLPAVFDGDDTR